MVSRKTKKQLPLRMTDDEYQSLLDLKQFLNQKTDTKTIIIAITKYVALKRQSISRATLLIERDIEIQRLEGIIASARDASLALLDKPHNKIYSKVI